MYTLMLLISTGSLFLPSTLGVCRTARCSLVEVSPQVVEVGPFDTDQDLLVSRLVEMLVSLLREMV